jgi:hypothetical protein
LVIDRRGIDALLGNGTGPRSAMMFVLGVRDLRRELMDWRRRYHVNRARNVSYNTHFLTVPLNAIRTAASLLGDYGVAYRGSLASGVVAKAVVRPLDGQPFSSHLPA